MLTLKTKNNRDIKKNYTLRKVNLLLLTLKTKNNRDIKKNYTLRKVNLLLLTLKTKNNRDIKKNYTQRKGNLQRVQVQGGFVLGTPVSFAPTSFCALKIGRNIKNTNIKIIEKIGLGREHTNFKSNTAGINQFHFFFF